PRTWYLDPGSATTARVIIPHAGPKSSKRQCTGRHNDRDGPRYDINGDRRLADDLSVALNGKRPAGGDSDGLRCLEVADVWTLAVLACEDVPEDRQVVDQVACPDDANIEAAIVRADVGPPAEWGLAEGTTVGHHDLRCAVTPRPAVDGKREPAG